MKTIKGIGALLAGGIFSVGSLISGGCSGNSNQDLERRVTVLERENKELKQKVAAVQNGAPVQNVKGEMPASASVSASSASSKEEKPSLFAQDSLYNFDLKGEMTAGFRSIQSDRDTGNETSGFYLFNLSGDLRKENIGLHGRITVKPSVGETARHYEVFEELTEEFQARELYIYADFGNHRVSAGKVKLPLGPDNTFEDERWNEPLLEYYLERYGTYDIGVRLDSKWSDNFSSRFALTGGNAGQMDTNSALCFSGDLGYKLEVLPLELGLWGKYNYIDTTPIKKIDHAFGPYFVLEDGRWKLLGKAGVLKQGFTNPDFTEEELERNGYNRGEIEKLLLQRDIGDVKRTIRTWYVYGSMPFSESVDLFAQFGQAIDPEDSKKKTRSRVGAGLDWEVRKSLNFSLGATLDNSTSNTRPYLIDNVDDDVDLDSRNGYHTWWLKLGFKF